MRIPTNPITSNNHVHHKRKCIATKPLRYRKGDEYEHRNGHQQPAKAKPKAFHGGSRQANVQGQLPGRKRNTRLLFHGTKLGTLATMPALAAQEPCNSWRRTVFVVGVSQLGEEALFLDGDRRLVEFNFFKGFFWCWRRSFDTAFH